MVASILSTGLSSSCWWRWANLNFSAGFLQKKDSQFEVLNQLTLWFPASHRQNPFSVWTSGALLSLIKTLRGQGAVKWSLRNISSSSMEAGALLGQGQHSAARFYFRSGLLELPGALDQLTHCPARIRAWTRASWLWPNPDKSKILLTGWGREGAGRTSALCDNNLLFIVQISRPRDLGVLASAHQLIRRRMKEALLAFCWAAFLDQKLEPILLNILSYTQSSREWTSKAAPLPGARQALPRPNQGFDVQILHPEDGWQSQGMPDIPYLSSLEEWFPPLSSFSVVHSYKGVAL